MITEAMCVRVCVCVCVCMCICVATVCAEYKQEGS